jgi:hypothetical protein
MRRLLGSIRMQMSILAGQGCSFCGLAGERIVDGPGVRICECCVARCVDILYAAPGDELAGRPAQFLMPADNGPDDDPRALG